MWDSAALTLIGTREEAMIDGRNRSIQLLNGGISGKSTTDKETETGEAKTEKAGKAEEGNSGKSETKKMGETKSTEPEETATTAETIKDQSGGVTGAENTFDGMSLVWAGVIFLAGVLAALLGVWLRNALKKNKEAPSQGKTSRGEVSREKCSPSIGKLHALGSRKNQQDSFSVSSEEMIPTHGLLTVVADGMGGLADGDQMSQCAITAMLETFYRLQGDPGRILLMLVESATRAVNAKLGRNNYSTSGSTLVAGLIKDGAFHYVSVGDSRICLYRDGFLYQLNREHVFRQELEIRAINQESSWDTVDAHPKANGLTSFLGMGSLKYVDIPAEAVQIRPGDKFILMSDGVYNSVGKEEMAAQLAKDAQEAADGIGKLIEEKNISGQDNYTAVIIAC